MLVEYLFQENIESEMVESGKQCLHAVIRKRAVHKATLERYNTAFTRCITWVMPLEEYTRVYAKMRDMKNCVLSYSNIIMHYYFNTGQQVPIVAEKHGNAKRQNAPDFRPKEHSLKQSCKELVKQDFRAPRLICQEMQEKEDVLESITDAPLIRDPKQISNYRQRYGSQKSRKDNDAIRDVIFGLLEQSDNEERDLLDKDQPFIQELLIRHGKQAAIVGYLQQTLKDVERFILNRVILKDMFEGPESLYESPSDGNYLQKVAVLKEKWRGIEEEFTKNRPPCKFNKYFEVYKENQIRTKMILAVRREAKVEGEYGQNPIEWQNFLTKEEIDDCCKRDGEGHSDVSITTALAALKNRYLRLYQNVVRALYDEGPYMLSPPFSQFAVSFDEWKGMSKEERSRHMKSFMSYVPTPAVLRLLEDSALATSLCLSSNSRDNANNANTKSSASQKEGPRRLLLTAVEANIPGDAVDASTLQDIFKKAEFLLNEPGAVMKAASSDERMRTVKSRYGSMPLIVKPQPKNRV